MDGRGAPPTPGPEAAGEQDVNEKVSQHGRRPPGESTGSRRDPNP